MEPIGEKAMGSEKVDLNTYTGPKRFLLFDNLIVTVVDFDPEDGAPIVEFSMCFNEEDEAKLHVECGICPDVMHKRQLEKHIETHVKYVGGVKRFACIYCEDHFASRACAAAHLRRHEGIRPYVCEVCKVYYCTKQDLRMHQKRRHWTKDHICEHCGKTFTQNSVLRSHIISSHEQQRRYACEQCGKRFLRRYTMNEHIRSVHQLNRRYWDCTFCDKIFTDTHKLAQHRKEEHLNQPTYECRVCGLEFTTIDFFDAHRRSLQCRGKKRKYRDTTEEVSKDETENIFIKDDIEVEIVEEIEPDVIETQSEMLEPQVSQQFITTKTMLMLPDGKNVIVDENDEVLYEIAVEELTEMQ